MNYTKGEWGIIPSHDHRTHILSVTQYEERKNICELSVRAPAEVEANAHLISAAPDMYECLRLANFVLSSSSNPAWVSLVNRIQIALAKAEGK